MQNRVTLVNKEIHGLGLHGFCHFSPFVNFPFENQTNERGEVATNYK